MSRSAADATRFTATSPHAYAKPTAIRSTPSTYSASSSPRSNTQPHRFPNTSNPKGPGPKPSPNIAVPRTETPQEKVARLRAARFALRDAQLTRWDKVVIRGRVWADRTHKVTTLSIVGFSVIAAGVAAFAMTDMILHNRRKRSAFYAEQRDIYTRRLLEAIETERAGRPLDEDQAVVMNRERARVQAQEAKKQRTWGKTIKGFLFSDLKNEDVDPPPVVPSEGEVLDRLGVDQVGVLKASEGKGRRDDTERPVEEPMAEQMKQSKGGVAGVLGGPLDHMADQAANDVESKIVSKAKGGWTSFLGGK